MTDLKNIRSILVIKMRNIGDVLLTTPVFANLRQHFPEARICALVNSGTEQMLMDNPNINRIYVYNRSAKQKSLPKRIVMELRLLAEIRKEHFDLVLNLTDGDRGAIVAITSGARYRIGVNSQKRGFKGKDRLFTTLLPPNPLTMHTVDQNLRYLEAIGLGIIHKRVSFSFSDDIRDEVLQLLRRHGLEPKRYFHAHVTSRWMFKTMPPEKMAWLLDTFHERSGLPAVLESAPIKKELDYLHEVLRHCRYPHVTLEGDVGLKQLGVLSANACFHVGIDSAPMHIAASLDVPVLGIFGPLPVANWGPWDNSLMTSPYTEKRGIQTGGKHIALQSDKPCVPCHLDGCNGSKKSHCLDFNPEEMDQLANTFIEMIKNA